MQLVLPTLPGIDPLLCLYICVDGEPYAQLLEPLDLLNWSEHSLGMQQGRKRYLRLPLTSIKPSKGRIQ